MQYAGVSKCRECALFQLSCPKGGPRGRPSRASSTETCAQTPSDVPPATTHAPLSNKRKRRNHTEVNHELNDDISSLRKAVEDNASVLKKMRKDYMAVVTLLHDYTSKLMQE